MQLDTRPSYVANVLAAAGQTPAYHDLYVSTVVQSGYTQQERGLLRFKDVHAAQQSVHRLDTLYHACEHQHDRRGQHQAQVLALIGKNRAEGLSVNTPKPKSSPSGSSNISPSGVLLWRCFPPWLPTGLMFRDAGIHPCAA